jgi:hypothetical protein
MNFLNCFPACIVFYKKYSGSRSCLQEVLVVLCAFQSFTKFSVLHLLLAFTCDIIEFNNLERIQIGDQNTDTDCMSSMNQETCWDAGDMLGWDKAQGRAETSAPWTPSPWKASPCHDKQQAGHHHHAAAICTSACLAAVLQLQHALKTFRRSNRMLSCWSYTWQKKKKEETKLWNLEPPACKKLLQTTLYWENRRDPALSDTGSKPAWEM